VTKNQQDMNHFGISHHY